MKSSSARLPVRAVLFDAVGTLILPRPSVAEAYVAAAARHGCRVDASDVRDRFPRIMAEEEARDQDRLQGTTSESHERERWRRIVGRVLPELSSTEAVFDDLWEHFGQASSWIMIPQAIRASQTLRHRGYRLGIASNFDERLVALAARLPELAIFDDVFVASRLGNRKPHPGFFAGIESAMRLRPEELLLVGDDPRHDFAAARAAGWQAWLVGPPSATSEHAEAANYAELLSGLPRIA